jgi:hypothetical protein
MERRSDAIASPRFYSKKICQTNSILKIFSKFFVFLNEMKKSSRVMTTILHPLAR